jgi:hypothetical protein
MLHPRVVFNRRDTWGMLPEHNPTGGKSVNLESLNQFQRKKLHTFGVTEAARFHRLLSDPTRRKNLLEELGLTEETLLPVELELKQLQLARPAAHSSGTLIPEDW